MCARAIRIVASRLFFLQKQKNCIIDFVPLPCSVSMPFPQNSKSSAFTGSKSLSHSKNLAHHSFNSGIDPALLFTPCEAGFCCKLYARAFKQQHGAPQSDNWMTSVPLSGVTNGDGCFQHGRAGDVESLKDPAMSLFALR